MAITVHILTEGGKMAPVEVPEGVKIDFSHPGSPMSVLGKEGNTLLIVHPHQWVFAEQNEEDKKTFASSIGIEYEVLGIAVQEVGAKEMSGYYAPENDNFMPAFDILMKIAFGGPKTKN